MITVVMRAHHWSLYKPDESSLYLPSPFFFISFNMNQEVETKHLEVLDLPNLKISIYKTIILLVVLYGCETWSLTLGEEHRLRVFENRALRRIFRPKRDEMTGEWRKLHNEELRDLYSSPSIIGIIKSRRMRCI
jgi:hypothetical protein